MPTFNISAAARAVGTSRASIQRAIKSGRLSATTNEQGERVIDLSELLRVFGPLKQGEQASMDASMDGEQRDTPSIAVHEQVLIEVLREHLDDAREQLQQAQQEKARLLSMLEVEQAARRELETKLLPAPVPPPKPSPPSHRWVWLLLILLVALLAFAGFGGGNSLAAPFPNYVGNSPVVKMGCNHELVTLNSHYALLILAIPM